jgi:acetyl esterase/lipase
LLPIWPGAALDSSTWTDQEMILDGIRIVRNVSVPSLEVFAPTGPANGTAVIVAPGGAYHLLAVDHEGTEVAGWLAAQGVTAFVLRYRIAPTPTDDVEMVAFQRELDNRIRTAPPRPGGGVSLGAAADRAKALGDEDGRQAIRFLRGHAAAWGINPQRVGIVGFSAGGSVAMESALAPQAAARPDFAAPIYPPLPESLEVPAGAPPLFLAHALDDPALPPTGTVAIWQAWHAAGIPAELHLFRSGGHGFGMHRLGLASDAWITLFQTWLRGLGMLDGAS